MTEITKKELKHLAQLARIEISPSEEEKLIKDLQEIISYFEELKKLDTENVSPMTGGTFLENIFYEGEDKNYFDVKKATQQFLEKENNFLKIPGVFE